MRRGARKSNTGATGVTRHDRVLWAQKAGTRGHYPGEVHTRGQRTTFKIDEFPSYEDALQAAIEWRGEATPETQDPFDVWASRIRGDLNDAGPRGHTRSPSTVKGLHRATRPRRDTEFEWKPEQSMDAVAAHVGRMLALRFTGAVEWPLVMPGASPRSIEFAASYGVVVESADQVKEAE